MFNHPRNTTQSTITGLPILRRAWIAALILALFGVLPLLPGRALAFTCSQGCKRASIACQLAGKAQGKGCRHSCQATYDASDRGPEAMLAYKTCKMNCKIQLADDKNACKTTLTTCAGACDLADPVCAATCGDRLHACASIVVGATQACIDGCANNGPCLVSCADPGNVTTHQGDAATNDCYTNANTGLAVCLSGGCTAVCGNGAIEPGEECDDLNTVPNDGCSATCILEDEDGDGILDDGDGNGIPGDAPCIGGNTSNCDDNCPSQANPTQADTDGDSVGDVCDYNCTGSSSAVIEGGVYLNSVAPANALPGAYVTACNVAHTCCSQTVTDVDGAYQFANLIPGTYAVSAQPAGNVLAGAIGPFHVVTGTETFSNENIVRGGPLVPPPGTTITGGTNGGVPSINPSIDQTLTTSGCANGTVTWTVTHPNGSTSSGAMTETPANSGSYTATLPASPATFIGGGANLVTIDFVCPNPLDDWTINFNVYIDPSGYTRFLNGAPAVGATIILLRSDIPIGPFTVVPDGSAIMSPQNRTNPDTSDATGHFGWDVIAGYYKVRAEIHGCVAETGVLTIPPPVTDLDLVFECPCVAGPTTGCRTATKGQLALVDDTDDSKDSFIWKWSKGQATSQMDFGTPLNTTNYDVCVYANGVPVTALTIPADAMSWKATGSDGTKGYKYGDSDGLNSGVTKVMLSAGANEKARVLVKAKGVTVPDFTLGSLPVPITVQLQRSDSSTCIESSFDANDVLDNSAAKLRVRVQ